MQCERIFNESLIFLSYAVYFVTDIPQKPAVPQGLVYSL